MKRKDSSNDKSEILKRKRHGDDTVHMAYVSPSALVQKTAPTRFPPTNQNVMRFITEQAMRHQGKSKEEIDKAVEDLKKNVEKIDYEAVDRAWFQAGTIREGNFPETHPFSWVNRYVLDSSLMFSSGHDRAMAAVTNIGKRHAGTQQTNMKNNEELQNELDRVEKNTGELGDALSKSSFPANSPIFMCALTDALTREYATLSTVSDEAAKVLLHRTDAKTGLSQALQIIEIDETPITRTYMREFMRAPIPGTGNLEMPCIRGSDCFAARSSARACFRGFHSPTEWKNIMEVGEAPQHRTMCIICNISLVNLWQAMNMTNDLRNAPMPLAAFTFLVGDGPDAFKESLMISPMIGFGLFAPFLSISAGSFKTEQRKVTYNGNTFKLPAFEFANFQ